ncbi:uncharacterized protein LOC106768789 isoform X3 [Vigna radiata var. radiata]|uniref:Uncharacterized protein LOC106768789 isoform X3 n=1 Tax=Vigna radiata var. radiata TaxID=3916 RepID=A0A3Q0FBR3_VIGRR|nr:uncharacterized protein LOC106768789 isoform X3 [Vigna radiata var. radiata]
MEQLVNFIIRPPRAEYDPKSDLLEQEFMLKGKWYQRKDVEIKNSRGDVLQCSHYMPIVSPEGKPLPCVIYCHGNSGCRADASEAAIILLPSNITVFTLDFSGSGISGGEHVTLGWNEKDDLKAVVNYLRDDGNVSLIGLWGRSMGAVTSLMYGAEDPSIAGMVLDSPFSDLVDLMMELVDTYKIRLPKFTVKFAIQYMRRAIQKKAKFDITDLNTIKVAKSCFVPALLGHAIEDDFIQPHHSDRIFEAYMDVWRSVHELGYNIESSSRNKEPSASSTINAIEQVRSRRPMSRMEVPSDISSKDERHEHEQEKGGDHSPSPSSMISFELSNGDPFGPHVPAALEDDQYVEYQLDDLAGFPSTSEEEERMFMEAVMESLKDLEVRNSNAEQPTSSVSTLSVAGIEPSDKDASSQENSRSTETESSSLKHSTDSTKSKTTSSASEECETLEGESYSISVNHSQNVVSKPSLSSEKLQSQSQSQSQSQPPLPPASTGTSSVIESSNTSDSAHSSSSGSLKSSSETDISHNTKATVTVVRNPAGHAMDGLMRRLDFNFFKNK